MPEINRDAKDYPYEQIAAWVRDRIHSGDLRPGMPIPSEMTLGQEFPEVARTTIRRAVKLLREEGVVETRPGRGSFVKAPDVPPAGG